MLSEAAGDRLFFFIVPAGDASRLQEAQIFGLFYRTSFFL
jgi:hypothetical protein